MKKVIVLSAILCGLILSQCSKNKDGKVVVNIKAIDTVNLDGRWAGQVYTGDNSTLGSFTLTLSESIDPTRPTTTRLDGGITTPPLCQELENEGHTSVPFTTIGGTHDPVFHDISISFSYTTTRFLNGNIVPGVDVGWQLVLDSLWVNAQGQQLTENAVIEGTALTTKNCNSQGYRVKITKMP